MLRRFEKCAWFVTQTDCHDDTTSPRAACFCTATIKVFPLLPPFSPLPSHAKLPHSYTALWACLPAPPPPSHTHTHRPSEERPRHPSPVANDGLGLAPPSQCVIATSVWPAGDIWHPRVIYIMHRGRESERERGGESHLRTREEGASREWERKRGLEWKIKVRTELEGIGNGVGVSEKWRCSNRREGETQCVNILREGRI